jgi:hypothetical protein
MPRVEVLDVIQGFPPAITGAFVDSPLAGYAGDVHVLEVQGWVVGRRAPAVAVAVRRAGRILAEAVPAIDRADVRAAVPEATGPCGFTITFGLATLPLDAELVVEAVLEDGSRATIGRLHIRRRGLAPARGARFQPIMIENLGRSGSTWFNHVLGAHPEIVTHEPFTYEPRVASYWLEILRTLSEPRSYEQMLLAEVRDAHWWIGEGRTPLPLSDGDGSGIRTWLGGDHLDQLAASTVERIDAFYTASAALLGRPEARLFAERFYGTSDVAWDLLTQLYEGPRHLILVRDFRDMACSMLAFSRKQRKALFDHHEGESDEEFIRRLAVPVRGLVHRLGEAADHTFAVRYEDLVLRPLETLAATFGHLGVADDAPTVAAVLELASGGARRRQAEHKTTGGPEASVGRWKVDLAPDLQRLSEAVFGDALRAFGYEV